MFAKFVRCFLIVIFCMMFSVVGHTQVTVGSDTNIVVLHASSTSNVSPMHISDIGSTLSVTEHAEISLSAATGFSPRFDMVVAREGERLILSGREEEEREIAVSIEVRSRGPPEYARWKEFGYIVKQQQVSCCFCDRDTKTPAPLRPESNGGTGPRTQP
jgi:hypothetical protein